MGMVDGNDRRLGWHGRGRALSRGWGVVGFVATLLVVTSLLAGCRAAAEAADTPPSVARLSLQVTPAAPAIGPAQIEVSVQTPAGAPLPGAHLQVRGDMSMAGMAPVIANLQDQGNGHYATTSGAFQFTMAGDWILTVSGSLPDGTAIHKTFQIHGVSATAS
jgi:hypothetical protein